MTNKQSGSVYKLWKGCDSTNLSTKRKLSGVSPSTCLRQNHATRENSYDALSRSLKPTDNRNGCHSVETPEETQIIKSKIKDAASRGFAIDNDEIRTIFVQIVSDVRLSYSTSAGLPSNDIIRRWRAQNRDITYCHTTKFVDRQSTNREDTEK